MFARLFVITLLHMWKWEGQPGNGLRVKAICLALSMPVISGVDCWPAATADDCAVVRIINKALRGQRLPQDSDVWRLMLT